MKMKQLTREELAAKRVGGIINLIIAIAGAAFCVCGIFMWAQRNLNF